MSSSGIPQTPTGIWEEPNTDKRILATRPHELGRKTPRTEDPPLLQPGGGCRVKTGEKHRQQSAASGVAPRTGSCKKQPKGECMYGIFHSKSLNNTRKPNPDRLRARGTTREASQSSIMCRRRACPSQQTLGRGGSYRGEGPKPRGRGTRVTWGLVFRSGSCPRATDTGIARSQLKCQKLRRGKSQG